jgi:8-oxo-dGTP pyrophosphatase MutT (NUDIX family)
VLVYVHRRRPDGEHEVLLLHRVPRGGSFWQGVTGAPQHDETDAEGAARELREETGFSAAVEPLDFRYDLYRSEEATEQWLELYGPGVYVVPEETFAAEVPFGTDPVITDEEHDAFRWCSFDEADALLKWKENRQALTVLRKRLAD